MTYDNKKVMVSEIYCAPSQNNSEFDLFLSNFKKFLSDISKRKPSLCVITGDFNARSSSRWPKGISNTGWTNLVSLTSSNGFSQIIKEPTHIQTSSSSYIDLIFIVQPNLSVNSGVHISLHPSRHHIIGHCSFNLNPLIASVLLIWKLVTWLAQYFNWLVSIWGQHWHLMS